MNRRKFVGNSIKACVSTLFIDQITNSAFASSSLVKAILGSCNDNILVIVQLAGGNDGLNTVIPMDQYSGALALPNNQGGRSNILIPEDKVLRLSGLPDTAFHPSMSGLRDLYNSSNLSFVQACGYPNPDFSHFRSTDIWMTASDSNQFLKTGWIGRNIEELYPGFPNGFPSDEYPDPLAIQIGSTVALAFEGNTSSTALAVTNISEKYELLGGFGDMAEANTRSGTELAFIRGVAIDTDKYNARIVTAANKQSSNLSSLYGTATEVENNPLAQQLQNVARLIKGGLKTRVYMVSMTGFDTHASQTESDTTKGIHASLLEKVSKAISGFQDDLIKMGVNNKVTGLVFSEFGRRVNSNGSFGSDHGTAMPVMLFGTELKGGMYGSNPGLRSGNKVLDNVPMQHDFRSVYYSLLKDWFCLSGAQLSNIFGGKSYEYISLFNNNVTGINSSDLFEADRINNLIQVYPNPVSDQGRIEFTTNGGHVLIEVVDTFGNTISTVLNKKVNAGRHTVNFERGNLKTGLYLIRMRKDDFVNSQKVILK